MSYLLDTVVVSEPNKASPDERILTFLQSLQPDDSYVSVITIGEIANGIELMPLGARRLAYGVWFTEVQQSFADWILVIDDGIAHQWGVLAARIKRRGGYLDVPDGLIAATALVHGLTLVTRNVDDFAATGVPIVNPWDEGT